MHAIAPRKIFIQEGEYTINNSSSPGSSFGQFKWDLWWTKWNWDRFSASTSVSPATHSTDCSILIIYHPGPVH
jgi:hypothetical protein